MNQPYRMSAERPLEVLPRKRRAWLTFLRFHFLPPLFTKCPHCEERTCPHANLLSYYMLICIIAAWTFVLWRVFQ